MNEITLAEIRENMIAKDTFEFTLDYPIYREVIQWEAFTNYVAKLLEHYHPELEDSLTKGYRKEYGYSLSAFEDLLRREWRLMKSTPINFLLRKVIYNVQGIMADKKTSMRITKAFRKAIHKLSDREISERYPYDNRLLQQITEAWKEVNSSKIVANGLHFEFAPFDPENGPKYYNNESSCIWGSPPYSNAQFILVNNKAYAIRAWDISHITDKFDTCDARSWAFLTENGIVITNVYGKSEYISTHLIDFLNVAHTRGTIAGAFSPIDSSGTYLIPKKESLKMLSLNSHYDPSFEAYREGPCCYHCDEFVGEYDGIYIEAIGDIVCDNCLSEYYTRCSFSEEYYPDDEIVEVVANENGYRAYIYEGHMNNYDVYYCTLCEDAYHLNYLISTEDGEVYCEDCFASSCNCAECGEAFLKEDLEKVGDEEYLCPDCHSTRFFKCEDCKCYTDLDYVRYVDSSELCPFCAEERKDE